MELPYSVTLPTVRELYENKLRECNLNKENRSDRGGWLSWTATWTFLACLETALCWHQGCGWLGLSLGAIAPFGVFAIFTLLMHWGCVWLPAQNYRESLTNTHVYLTEAITASLAKTKEHHAKAIKQLGCNLDTITSRIESTREIEARIPKNQDSPRQRMQKEVDVLRTAEETLTAYRDQADTNLRMFERKVEEVLNTISNESIMAKMGIVTESHLPDVFREMGSLHQKLLEDDATIEKKAAFGITALIDERLGLDGPPQITASSHVP